ncbi:hypothetical protein ACJO5Y_15520 [Marinobacter sp. GN3S48]|uniref:hypothetical protein n=1 Tax=Marinobacter sp. GN3S48 TaxID=3382302 RepID=UPI00387B1E05
MSLRHVLGIIILGHSAFVAVQLAMNFDDLRQQATAFAAPLDPFLYLSGFVAFNALIIIAAASLGAYLMRAKELKLLWVLPLAIVASLYGGYSLGIGAAAFGLCLRERYQSRKI